MGNQTIDNLLNFDSVIEGKLIDIKKAFISFYGAENAELINEKLSNVLFASFSEPGIIRYEIGKAIANINKSLFPIFFEKAGIEMTDENISKLLSSDISNCYSTPIAKYAKYLATQKEDFDYEFWKNQANSFVKSYFGKKIDELAEEELTKLNDMVNAYNEIVEEYNKQIAKYEPYKEYVKSCDELQAKLKKKYFVKFIEQNIELLTEEERKEFEKFKNTKSIYYSSISEKYFVNIDVTANIEYFTKENMELAKKGNFLSRIKQIELFKSCGIDLGDDYESYLNDERCQIIIDQNISIAEKLQQERIKLCNECLNEYYSSLPEFARKKEMIDAAGLYSKDQTIDSDIYTGRITCISPNIKLQDGQFIEAPILFFCVGDMIDFSDARLIHELNHAFELNMTDVNEQEIHFTCGWDLITSNVEQQNTPDELGKRDYELFNEIINEMIAQEITTKLHEQGNYIFNNENDAQIKGATSYERTIALVRDFYSTYKDDIIASRRNGNINIILEKVGKENFDALNNLFHEFNKEFGGNAYYAMRKDFMNKKDTELTRKFNEIMAKKDDILKRMSEYCLEKDTKIVA